MDAVDATPGDGACDDGAGNCTVRAAIMEANAVAGTAAITLPGGTYTLSIAGADEKAAKTGDLNITDDLIIEGAGADTTIVDGGGLDRVFQVGVDVNVAISGVTVQNGAGGDGGGIWNLGTLTLTNSTVSDNSAVTQGGGIYNQGTLTLTNVTVSGNRTAKDGGGISSHGGTLTLTNSTVSDNSALNDGGG
ncbi:MAG: hypothetical protein V3U31_03480, partial [Dehalococcoidia bacterium]